MVKGVSHTGVYRLSLLQVYTGIKCLQFRCIQMFTIQVNLQGFSHAGVYRLSLLHVYTGIKSLY